MPCRSGDEGMPSHSSNNYNVNSDLAAQLAASKFELDRVTAILCAVLNKTEKDIDDDDEFEAFMLDCSDTCKTSVKKWYEKHIKTDRVRVIKELRDNFTLDEIRLIKKMFKEGQDI